MKSLSLAPNSLITVNICLQHYCKDKHPLVTWALCCFVALFLLKNLQLSRTCSEFSILTLLPQKPLNCPMPALICSMLWVSASASMPIPLLHRRRNICIGHCSPSCPSSRLAYTVRIWSPWDTEIISWQVTWWSWGHTGTRRQSWDQAHRITPCVFGLLCLSPATFHWCMKNSVFFQEGVYLKDKDNFQVPQISQNISIHLSFPVPSAYRTALRNSGTDQDSKHGTIPTVNASSVPSLNTDALNEPNARTVYDYFTLAVRVAQHSTSEELEYVCLHL